MMENSPSIEGIAEESIGAKRDTIWVATKVLSRIEHYVDAGHIMSNENHGGKDVTLGSDGQANLFSDSVYRDVSCFTSKDLDEKR